MNARSQARFAEGASTLPRIREHLNQKSIEALVEMIIDLANLDPVLFRELDMAAAAARADDKTLETRLTKAIE